MFFGEGLAFMQDDVAFVQTWGPFTKIRNLSLISSFSPSAKTEWLWMHSYARYVVLYLDVVFGFLKSITIKMGDEWIKHLS